MGERRGACRLPASFDHRPALVIEVRLGALDPHPVRRAFLFTGSRADRHRPIPWSTRAAGHIWHQLPNQRDAFRIFATAKRARRHADCLKLALEPRLHLSGIILGLDAVPEANLFPRSGSTFFISSRSSSASNCAWVCMIAPPDWMVRYGVPFPAPAGSLPILTGAPARLCLLLHPAAWAAHSFGGAAHPSPVAKAGARQ